MIELSTIRDLVAIFGVIAGFSYYVLTVRVNQKNQEISLRNQELTLQAQEQATETRQVQLFQHYMEQLISEEMRQIFIDFFEWEWSDPEDFLKQYGPNENLEDWNRLGTLFSIYERIGILYKEGIFDINMLYDMAGSGPVRVWEKFEPVADYYRINYEEGVKGMWWEYFEDLAYALKELLDIDRVKYSQRYQRRKQTRAKYGKTIPEYNP